MSLWTLDCRKGDIKMTVNMKIKKNNPNAIVPTRGSSEAAGYDLYACIDSPIDIKPGETVKIGTGICFQIPNGYFGGIFARSGLATKQGLRPPNCVGVIDSDYRGEVIAALHNDSSETRIVSPGDRIAQMIILPFLEVNFIQVNELDLTDRGCGGFGSTGISKKQ